MKPLQLGQILKTKRHFVSLLMLPVVAGAVILGYIIAGSYAATANVTVNFGAPVTAVDPNAFSGTISTYGQDGGNIVVNAKQRTALGALGSGLYRLPLRWNGGNIISSAGGGPTNISGDAWVSAVKSFGGVPQIVLGGSTDNNFTPQDGANMVSHFSGANRVAYWVIGNEPGNGGMSIGTYCTLFNQTAAAMKAVDPTIKVAGPAWAYYDAATLQSFLNCAGSTVDIIDYHHYAMGGSYLSSATALSQTGDWENEVTAVRAMINATVPGRASQIGIQVGELNWAWQTADGYPGAYQGDDRFYQAVNTVWSASVLGHIIKAGGIAHQYADQNGALGITFEKSADASHFGRAIDDPMPMYYGWQMFSGGPFRRFGSTLVQASTTLSNTEVFASTASDNIVLINKDPSASKTAIIQTSGVTAGTAEVWQTAQAAPFNAPGHVASATISGSQVQVTLPPYSVTTLVVTPGSATPAPTAAPTPTPSTPPHATATPTITPTPTPAPVIISVGSGTSLPPGSTTKVSGNIVIAPTPGAKTTIKVDGKTTSTDGKIDTTQLTNGQHDITIQTTTPDGHTTVTTRSIQVNNKLTPWQTTRNQLVAAYHSHPIVTTALVIVGMIMLSAGGFLLLRHLRRPRPAQLL
jgi:hypothetical protein